MGPTTTRRAGAAVHGALDTCRYAGRCLAALTALLVVACAPEPEGPRRVVLIVIDATDAGQLSCYGGPEGLTPNLDALAGRGVRFERAFSNTTWTLPSTTSLLTGQLQETHGVLTNHHRAHGSLELLPEAFARAGWRTGAFVQMLYASGAFGLDQGFDDYAYAAHTERTADESLAETALDWLDGLGEERAFLYLHLRRPHSPYDPRPLDAVEHVGPWPFGEGEPPDQRLVHADVLGERELPEEARAGAEYLYRANLATVDRRLAPLLDALRGRSDTLVVLTSDHGEALGQHGFFGHGDGLWEEVVHVPLVYAGDGLAPRTVEVLACTVDLVPTLVELCGLEWPEDQPLDGRSLAGVLRGEAARERTLTITARYPPDASEAPPAAALRGDEAVVLEPEGRARPLGLSGEPPGTPDEALLEAARAAVRRGLERVDAGRADAGLSEEQREELRALGYTEDL